MMRGVLACVGVGSKVVCRCEGEGEGALARTEEEEGGEAEEAKEEREVGWRELSYQYGVAGV